MPTPGPLELVIILVIALLILGPGKLPDVGAALGKSIKEFRKASADVQEAVNVNVDTSPLPPAQVAPPAPAQAAPAQAAAPSPAQVAPAVAVAAQVAPSAPVAAPEVAPAAAPAPEVAPAAAPAPVAAAAPEAAPAQVAAPDPAAPTDQTTVAG